MDEPVVGEEVVHAERGPLECLAGDDDMHVLGQQALQLAESRDVAVMPGFNSQGSWELANRIGKAFAASSLVPQQYQGNVANCIVALEMANRMGASPLMVMQNLYIVHGNPGWSSKFLVACFNQCGRFSALRYEWNADRPAEDNGLGQPVWRVVFEHNGVRYKANSDLLLSSRAWGSILDVFVQTEGPRLSKPSAAMEILAVIGIVSALGVGLWLLAGLAVAIR